MGRELLRGAEGALERTGAVPVEMVALDTGGEERVRRAEDAARQAAEDPSALAYLGDFHSGHEAMALILDSVADGGDDRQAIVSAARARHSPTTAYGCLAVVDGELVSA